ncbi:hypothetical protein K474DRAFT_1591869 [Panus rudis PR-1116 ss-1]|nr:hypothetical protein K474DRAFT_1591869 [Panus rudis PR-1116 ss-1]
MQQQQQQQQQRRRSWLSGLANVMVQRGTPLPPPLTGVAYPATYDPSTSPWRTLEVSSTDLGILRVAGKDVDLMKLWGLVIQAGGGIKVTQSNMWSQVVRAFDLPEQITLPNGQSQSMAATIQNIYTRICGPFEDAYRKNVLGERQRHIMAQHQSGMPIPGQARSDSVPGFPPQTNPLQRTGSNPNLASSAMGMGRTPGPVDPAVGALGAAPIPPRVPSQPTLNGMNGQTAETIPTDAPDPEGRKRKLMEAEEADSKRARQRTAGSDASDMRSSAGPGGTNMPTSSSGSTIHVPGRRKIEYIPYCRELDTTGGRELRTIEHEYVGQRPRKSEDLWGEVNMDALALSIRSRLPTELSYGLTTLLMLSIKRGSASGFPISQAPDLLDEVIDLIEDVAFGDEEDDGQDLAHENKIVTNLHITTSFVGHGLQPFANLEPKPGQKDPRIGPGQRPGDVILAATSILRNLANAPDNYEILSKHPKLLSVVLRVCALKPSSSNILPAALSPVLTISDFMSVRQDAVYILYNLASSVRLSSSSEKQLVATKRVVRRAYELLASYIVDPSEAIGPQQCALAHPRPGQYGMPNPPLLTNTALEAFTRLTQPDDHRRIFAKAIPQSWQWDMYEALIHRLPVSDEDFALVGRNEAWLAYLERLLLALYSLAFFSSPEMKSRVKTDKALRFNKIIFRLVRKLSGERSHALYGQFLISLRRAIETTKLLDDAEDSFDTSHIAAPTLAFGMGYGEHGEAKIEQGHGLFSGHQDEVIWQIMNLRELDDVLFPELESLVRVG